MTHPISRSSVPADNERSINLNGYCRRQAWRFGSPAWSALGLVTVLGAILVPATSRAASSYFLKQINPSFASGSPTNFATHNGITYFAAVSAAGRELWRTDGTAAGTTLVKDITPGSGHTFSGTNDSYMFVPMGSDIYFHTSSNQHLYKSSGTEAGTVDLTPLGMTAISSSMVAAGGLVYFVGNTVQSGSELWRTDGTAAGTILVQDSNGGPANSGISNMTAVGNALLFGTTTTGGFWNTEGTGATTTYLGQMTAINTTVVVGNVMYFFGSRPASGLELMRSDGTAAGTGVVKDLAPGPADADLSQLKLVGNMIYFLSGGDIYKSDGTEAGTVKVKTFSTASNSVSGFSGNAAIGSTLLYFLWGDATTGKELWVTDGTDAGTHLVKDIRPGSASSGVDLMARVGDRLYFRCNDGTNGPSLWKTDGTEANTVRIADTSPENIYYDGLGSIYFSDYQIDVANDIGGFELSKYTIPTAELPVVTTPLAAWRQAIFGSTEDTGDGANTADPDHDGLSNVLEFAMATDPKAATMDNAGSVGGTPQAGRGVLVPGVSGGAVPHVIFSMRKDLALSDLTVTPKFSTDLVAWTAPTAPPVVVSSDAEKEILSIDVPPAMQGSTRVFFQLGMQ